MGFLNPDPPAQIKSRTAVEAYFKGQRAYVKTLAICILVVAVAVSIPLLILGWVVKPFAGEDTTLSVTVTVTIAVAITVTLTGVSAALWVKLRRQRDELVRLRERCGVLEGQVLDSSVQRR